MISEVTIWRKEVKLGRRKLHMEELHNLFWVPLMENFIY
jgi:hypothetical protein